MAKTRFFVDDDDATDKDGATFLIYDRLTDKQVGDSFKDEMEAERVCEKLNVTSPRIRSRSRSRSRSRRAKSPLGPHCWENDYLQFARLLAEIRVCGLPKKQYKQLCEDMDLTEADIHEVFERAETAWQNHKRLAIPPRYPQPTE